MAPCKINLLKRMIDVQNITLEYKHKGSTQVWIYKNIIEKHYHISLSTFNKYLATNAKKELNELIRLKVKPIETNTSE